MQRVAVIGSTGAGKSTLSAKLGDLLGLPVVHLDRHYWRPGWAAPSDDEWLAQHAGLIAADAWIIDGNYSSTMAARVERADTVIYLDLPRWRTVARVLRRWLRHRGSQRPDMAEGCPDKIDWAFVRWTWDYPNRSRPKTLALLERVQAEGKTVIRLCSDRQSAALLARLRRDMRAEPAAVVTPRAAQPRASLPDTAEGGTPMEKRAAIYAWYRGASDEKGAESLDIQEERCRAYAQAAGYQVVGVFREGETRPDGDRPALRDLRAMFYRRGLDIVLATRPDRIYVDPDRLLRLATDARLLGLRLEFLEMPVELEQMFEGASA